jgi:hypothetical protein
MRTQTMSRKDYIEDLEDLLDRQPDPMPRDIALAIHGYVKGLSHARVITLQDYKRFRKRIPLDGQDLAEAGVNL